LSGSPFKPLALPGAPGSKLVNNISNVIGALVMFNRRGNRLEEFFTNDIGKNDSCIILFNNSWNDMGIMAYTRTFFHRVNSYGIIYINDDNIFNNYVRYSKKYKNNIINSVLMHTSFIALPTKAD
jgi:hypothetical protein